MESLSFRRLRWLVAVASALLLLLLLYLTNLHYLNLKIPDLRHSFPVHPEPAAPVMPSPTGAVVPGPLVRPPNITVSGLIFYGRKDRVECMHAYLERNLVDHGGWLDEVLWVANTDNKDDLRYLDELIAKYPHRYKKWAPPKKLWVYTYNQAWMHIERGKYYVKIDDDIVWIGDDAIPQLVTYKFNNPKDLIVSANIINNPPLGFLHYHMGAIHPYFPETKKPEKVSKSWKPSENPIWEGPNDFKWPLDKDPPYANHRWLRVRDDKPVRTPATELTYEVWGDSYTSWAIAAQMHYSLLENIETNRLDLYKFNRPWNMDGERIRINFLCVYADDLLNTDIKHWPESRGDEDMIVLDLPVKLHRPVVILGDALGAHFQYSGQPKLAETDLLARYTALALDLPPLSSPAR